MRRLPRRRGHDTHWKTAVGLGLVADGYGAQQRRQVHTIDPRRRQALPLCLPLRRQAARAGRIIYDTARAAQADRQHQRPAAAILRGFGAPERSRSQTGRRRARQKFIAATPGPERLLRHLESHAGKHSWLPGLDGRRVPVRALYTRFELHRHLERSDHLQALAGARLRRARARFRYGWDGDVVIALWIHDELVCLLPPEIADQVGEILVRHAKAPAEFYDFKVPLDAEYKIGRSWAGEPVNGGDAKAAPPTKSNAEFRPSERARDAAPWDCPAEPVPELIGEDKPLIGTEAPAATEARIEEITDPIIVASPAAAAAIVAITATMPRGTSGIEQAFAAVAESQERVPPTPPDPGNADGGNDRAGNGHDADNDFGNYFSGEGRPAGRPLERYVYCNEQGEPHQRKIRTTTKKFWQETWKDGRWVKGAPEIKYLYGIRELLAAAPDKPIWITEGEKDKNTLAALGLLAVTNPGGAGKWHSDFTAEQIERWFKGRRTIYLLEDNDAPGRKHVEIIGRALQPLVADIRVVAFRELAEKGDVTDWLRARAHQGRAVGARPAAPKYQPPALQSVSAADVTMTAVEWLWPNRFALGKLGLIVGLPDEGKGLLISYIAAQVTTGGAWPCDEGVAAPRQCASAHRRGRSERHRGAAAGRRRRRSDAHRDRQDGARGRRRSHVQPANRSTMLRRKIDEIGDVALVLIDPISAYLGVGKVDSYRTTDVRAVLGPVVDLAAELKLAIIGIMHFNKKARRHQRAVADLRQLGLRRHRAPRLRRHQRH